MSDRGLLSDILRRIAGSDRRDRPAVPEPDIIDACLSLLDEQSEASGLVRARQILDRLGQLTSDEKMVFYCRVANEFGVDEDRLQAAVEARVPGDIQTARAVHFAAEPRSQELIRMLNRVPGATSRLVALRAGLLEAMDGSAALSGLDEDFRHLFSSWFSRGFLELRRIDWSTPASILEKIIAYEAVHEITGWDDLRQRVGDADRRLFAFFHPAMPAEPLIFVQVALTRDIPGAIGPILSGGHDRVDPDAAKTAVLYSISNCQKGLRGISFGNFLIKQVVAELQRDLPQLSTFVTLSPVPGLRRWAERALRNEDPLLGDADHAALEGLPEEGRPEPEVAARLAARYLTEVKHARGTAIDPVAHFHLGNGASLHKIHPEADLSARGLSNSWSVMVNYLYDGNRIEPNHHTYLTAHHSNASPEVTALAES